MQNNFTRKQFRKILSAYIYKYIYIYIYEIFNRIFGRNEGILFFCVGKEASKSKRQRAEFKLIS